jgi:hypothetical protein
VTPAQAAALVCTRCRNGEPHERFTAGYFFHGNPLVRCDASPIWAAAAEDPSL